MEQNPAIFAIFRNKHEVQRALSSLKKQGFEKMNLRVLNINPKGSKDFVSEQKNQVTMGTVIGTVIGGILGGIISLLIIFNVIPLPIASDYSGVSKVLVMLAGILFGVIFGAGGGLLVGIGTPLSMEKRYGRYLSSGGFLLSVQGHSQQQIKQAEEILSATGGQDIHMANEYHTRMSALMESIKIEEFETNKLNPEESPRV